MRSEVVTEDIRTTSAHLAELALVGEISLLIHDARDLAPLDAALERVREYTEADACDLFLSHPDGSEAFLVSHVGEDGDAFGQQARFRLGEGLPGIVLQTQAAVWTRHLPDEIDFLRTRVTGRGYRSAVCIPLLAGGAVEGCVLVAWRCSKRHLRHTVHALTLAAHPLAAGIRLLRTRLLTDTRIAGSEAVGSEAILERLRSGIPTDSVRLIPAREQVENGTFTPCPACADGSVQVLGGRTGWPQACVQAGCAARARYCMGVDRGATGWTVATLAFREQEPVPLTRHVPAALWLARSGDFAPSDEVGIRTPSTVVRSPAHLEIRCLGRFEVLVDGRPVGHQRFGRSKAIELLALLASTTRPVAIEELERCLWPGVEASRTRNRLHVTLSALRSAVDSGREGAASHVQRDGGYYHLSRHSSVEVDLWRLEELLNMASAALRGRGSPELATRLQEAIALGRGDLFGGAFTGDWAEAVGRRMQAQLREAAERLEAISGATSPDLGIPLDS